MTICPGQIAISLLLIGASPALAVEDGEPAGGRRLEPHVAHRFPELLEGEDAMLPAPVLPEVTVDQGLERR